MSPVRSLPSLMISLILLVSATSAEPAERTAASYLPKNALAAVVVRDGDRRIEALHDWFDSIEFTESEVFQKLQENPEFAQARFAILGFSAAAGIDLWRAAGAVLGRDLAIGLVRGEPGKPQVIVAMVAREPGLIDRMLTSIHTLTGLVRDGKPDESRSKDVDGVRVFSAAPNAYHCRVDNALLFSNSRELMKSALESRTKPERGLAGAAVFGQAQKRVPADALAWAFVDAKALRSMLPADKPPDGPRDNPLGGFLFGAWWHAILHAESAVAWATADAKGLKLEASVTAEEERPEAYRGFAAKRMDGPTWNAADLPRFLSEVQVTRGWAELFSEREALLTTSGASQALQFTSTMSTLFGGMDFLNDVLPKLSGPTRLIAARQDFAKAAYLPSPKLPAFALVQPVRTGATADFAQRLGSATQMALSLVSLDMAQKNMPTYLIDVDRYRGQRIVFSTFSGPPSTSGMVMDAKSESRPQSGESNGDAGGTADAAAAPDAENAASIRYNFLPAAAVVENQYVVATSRQLLDDIVNQILDSKEKAGNASKSEAADSLTLDVPSLVTILRENRKELVINRMLEQSEAKAQAERAIDTFLGVLAYAKRLRFALRVDGKEHHAVISLSMGDPAKAEKP